MQHLWDGMLANEAHLQGRKMAGCVRRWLDGDEPTRHDVARAVRLAHLDALETVLTGFAAVNESVWDRGVSRRPTAFLEEAAAFCRAQREVAKTDVALIDVKGVGDLGAILNSVFTNAPEGTWAGRQAAAIGAIALDGVLAQLQAGIGGVPTPDSFVAFMRNGSDPQHPGFLACFAGNMREAVKTQPRVRDSLLVSGLADVEANGFEALEMLFRTEAQSKIDQREMASALGSVQRSTDALLNGQAAADTANERRHREQLEAVERLREHVARERGLDPALLKPLFDDFGQTNLTLDQMRERAGTAIEALRGRAREAIAASSEGADIDATIAAARARMASLDTAGARAVLATRIAEEREARLQRLLPLLEEQAALEQMTYDYQAARTTLRELLTLDPDRIPRWIELGNIAVTTGFHGDAIAAFSAARDAAVRLSASDPSNPAWLHGLGASLSSIGDVQALQRAPDFGLASFQAALTVANRLVALDPNNLASQRLLSVALEKIGDVHMACRELNPALKKFRAALAIMVRLAASCPANTVWQRDLALCHRKMGDLYLRTGPPWAALESYHAFLSISGRLAASNKADLDLERTLAAAHETIAHGRMAQMAWRHALKSHRAALAIRERLAGLYPANAECQFDVSVSHDGIGDVRLKMKSPGLALLSYRTALAIREALASSHAGGSAWTHHLAVSHRKIGDAQALGGALRAARESHGIELRIMESLTASDDRNEHWLRDLAVACARVALIDARQSRRDAALDGFRRGRAIVAGLSERQRDDGAPALSVDWFDARIAEHQRGTV